MSFPGRRVTKARRHISNLQNDLRGRAGIIREVSRNAGAVRIVTYHGICLRDPLRFNASFVTAATLEKHLRFYKEHFNVISLAEYQAGRFSKEHFNVCLTFDDGHRNNLKYALPLLEQYQLPAAFFITGIITAGYDVLWNDFLAVASRYGPKRMTYRDEQYHKNRRNHYVSPTDGHTLQDRVRNGDFVLKQEMMRLLDPAGAFQTKYAADADYWQQMTADEIKTLSRSPYAAVGAHGLCHNDLTKIPALSALAEFRACKSFLEDTIQKEVSSFAFPYGSYNPSVLQAGQDAGFRHFLALDHLFGEADNTLISERMVVNPYISTINQMLALVRGRY